MKVNRMWLWLVPLTLLWPILHLSIFFIRFGDMPSNALDALNFVPMSLTAGAIFLALWTRASKRPQKTGLILGYLVASPIAFIGSLLSGLVYQPMIGTFIWGTGPLAIGMFIGVLVGHILIRIRSNSV